MTNVKKTSGASNRRQVGTTSRNAPEAIHAVGTPTGSPSASSKRRVITVNATPILSKKEKSK